MGKRNSYRYVPVPKELVRKIDIDAKIKGFPSRITYFEEMNKRFDPLKKINVIGQDKEKKKPRSWDDFIDEPFF